MLVFLYITISCINHYITCTNYFINSIFYGKKAVQNPWKSNTLEWTAPVKHIHGNWIGDIPTVHRWAYDYSKPGHKDDFIPQNVPLFKGEEELQH